MIVTRFAPSPTGSLHIGGARTALFSWAFAKKNNGKFILRIEDTDLERSTKESVVSIIDAMNWLGLIANEGPIYQTHRMDRYKEVINLLLSKNLAYYCYCSKETLDEMRENQRVNGFKSKYDQRCLHNPLNKSDIKPVIRFKNPQHGFVTWDDMVKGTIKISNEELDDLIIARSDGTPTYNFCVVVDDFDMGVTHVIRGDDHVNNTPRQINILLALDAKIPIYAHIPMILRHDGTKMSKRTDAVSVMEYKKLGILPEALLNYLSRLCWGYKDNEVFTINEFLNWFDLSKVNSAPARFDMKKLLWVNMQHMKNCDILKLKNLVLECWNKDNSFSPEVIKAYENLQIIKLNEVISLNLSRCDNIVALAKMCEYFYLPKILDAELHEELYADNVSYLVSEFIKKISIVNEWTLDNIKLLIKSFCNEYSIKMPQIGVPLRIKLCGVKETAPFDSVIFVIGKEEVIKRLLSKN